MGEIIKHNIKTTLPSGDVSINLRPLIGGNKSYLRRTVTSPLESITRQNYQALREVLCHILDVKPSTQLVTLGEKMALYTESEQQQINTRAYN
ncbi:MAG: hypothetical protein M3P33_02180, partial [bacterium]|nr:hypothetical protein [bacterium]